MSKCDTQLVFQVRHHLFTKSGLVGLCYCDKRKTVLRLQETQSRWLGVCLLSVSDNSVVMQRKDELSTSYDLWFWNITTNRNNT